MGEGERGGRGGKGEWREAAAVGAIRATPSAVKLASHPVTLPALLYPFSAPLSLPLPAPLLSLRINLLPAQVQRRHIGALPSSSSSHGISSHGSSSVSSALRQLVREEGLAGLYRGLGPRSASMALWGTAMVTSYEFLSESTAAA